MNISRIQIYIDILEKSDENVKKTTENNFKFSSRRLNQSKIAFISNPLCDIMVRILT